MEQQPHDSSSSEEGSPATPATLSAHPEERLSEAEAASRRTDPAPEEPRKRIGWFEGHMPDIVDPLDPPHPENAFTETRRLRHDGWTPDRMRLFLERFGECGVVREACEAAGMSARAAYNLRDRDPLFAAGWEAASVKARAPLADEAYSRARNGVMERIYRDGAIVAERHRYDNRLTMAVLARLDARIDRAEEQGAAHLALAARWDEYLGALGEDRRDDAAALLAPPEPSPAEIARDRELRELYEGEEEEEEEDPVGRDPHDVWRSEGAWWTDFPPPDDFDGEEHGEYGDYHYKRRLAPAEQAVIDAEKAEGRARAEALRDAWFFGDPEDGEEEEPESSGEAGSG